MTRKELAFTVNNIKSEALSLKTCQKLPLTSDVPVQGSSNQLSCICEGCITQSY